MITKTAKDKSQEFATKQELHDQIVSGATVGLAGYILGSLPGQYLPKKYELLRPVAAGTGAFLGDMLGTHLGVKMKKLPGLSKNPEKPKNSSPTIA